MPFLDPNLELFVDRSSCFLNSNCVTGYSIMTVNGVVENSLLGPKLSAQAAGLIALTKACQLAKEKTVNIYTDSRYAFGVCHATGQLRKLCGFILLVEVKHQMLLKLLKC